jgi:hypothetical protein
VAPRAAAAEPPQRENEPISPLEFKVYIQTDVLDKVNEIKDSVVISDVVSDNGKLQWVDLVLAGGGMLGIALVGFVCTLEHAGIRFRSIGGTSAGAINAMAIAACREDPSKESWEGTLKVGARAHALACVCLQAGRRRHARVAPVAPLCLFMVDLPKRMPLSCSATQNSARSRMGRRRCASVRACTKQRVLAPTQNRAGAVPWLATFGLSRKAWERGARHTLLKPPPLPPTRTPLNLPPTAQMPHVSSLVAEACKPGGLDKLLNTLRKVGARRRQF